MIDFIKQKLVNFSHIEKQIQIKSIRRYGFL